MKHGFGKNALLASFVLALAAQSTLAASHKEGEKEEGFKPLFDGETTEGWRSYRKEGFPENGWVIDDGALHIQAGGGAGDIITEEQFTDFDFRFEWKVAEGANSGIFYRVTEEGRRSYDSGIEYQILDNDGHGDGKKAITSAASNYALYPPEGAETKPVGEWNTGRISQKGNHVEHWLNGKKVVEFEVGGEDWNKRIADSKFSDAELFAKSPTGHIGLQDHGNDVWFRNLRIKVLAE
jgi:hypothetical protein